MSTRIYALADPRNTEHPVYVGRTRSSLNRRYQALKLWDAPAGKWCRSLLAQGIEPVMFVLETCAGGNFKQRETFWIRFFRGRGPLLNRSEGDGCLGIKKGPPCAENRRLTIERNKRGLSLASRAKISASLKGKKMGFQQKLRWLKSRNYAALMTVFKEANEKRKKPVKCEETKERFPSIKEACAYLKCAETAFREAMRKGWRCCGRYWTFDISS